MKLSPLSFAVAFLALASSAQAVVYTGTTAGKPTFNRPLAGTPPTALSIVGTAVTYDAQSFTVSAAGSYTLLSTSVSPAAWDNFTFLYQTSFNPVAPLTNALTGNDDNPAIGSSGFTFTLATSTTYVFVTTGFSNTDFGTFSNSITGPGTVNLTPVPEPATYALMVSGLAALGACVRRRKATVAA